MKIILTIIIFLVSFGTYAQKRPRVIGDKGINVQVLDQISIDSSILFPKDTVQLSINDRAQAFKGKTLYIWRGIRWDSLNTNGGLLRYGGPISSLPSIDFNPNTIVIADWIDSVFYRAQPPLATLTGGVALELQSTGTTTQTINYSSSRQSATKNISTIIVAGVTKLFTQPGSPGTVTGSQSVTFPVNTDKSYSNITTTVDGKVATATTTFTFLPRRYWGWITDTTDIEVSGILDSQIANLNSEISNSKSKTFFTGNPTGTQFLVYAYYVPYGNLSQFDMNGFPSIDAMNYVSRTFTNSLGYTGTWFIYWSKNGQTLSSSVIAN